MRREFKYEVWISISTRNANLTPLERIKRVPILVCAFEERYFTYGHSSFEHPNPPIVVITLSAVLVGL